MNLADATTIKQLAQKYGIKPSALLGQNFLADENILARIISSASLKAEENVLEIGPGFGILTAKLLSAGVRVLAVENDKRLAGYLTQHFGQNPNFKLITDDILKIDNQVIQECFHDWSGNPKASYRIVSNLPYQITGKILKKFVSDTIIKPANMTILLQKEVAERICSDPGKLNLAAISVQLYSKPQIQFFVAKTAFWPVPKVDSALIKIDEISEKPLYPILDIKTFWQIVRVGFASPRKQLHNNLAAGLKLDAVIINRALEQTGLNPKARAQEVSIDQWIKIADSLGNKTVL